MTAPDAGRVREAAIWVGAQELRLEAALNKGAPDDQVSLMETTDVTATLRDALRWALRYAVTYGCTCRHLVVEHRPGCAETLAAALLAALDGDTQ